MIEGQRGHSSSRRRSSKLLDDAAEGNGRVHGIQRLYNEQEKGCQGREPPKETDQDSEDHGEIGHGS